MTPYMVSVGPPQLEYEYARATTNSTNDLINN